MLLCALPLLLAGVCSGYLFWQGVTAGSATATVTASNAGHYLVRFSTADGQACQDARLPRGFPELDPHEVGGRVGVRYNSHLPCDNFREEGGWTWLLPVVVPVILAGVATLFILRLVTEAPVRFSAGRRGAPPGP